MSQTLIVRRIAAWTYVVGAGLYLIHGLVTSTGLVGWLEALQQSLFGGYSMKMSLLFGLLIVAIPGALIAGGKRDPLSPGAVMQRANAPLGARGIAVLALGGVALSWLIGFGVRSWYVERARADVEATYVPLTLDRSDVDTPPAEHAALHARVLSEAVVTSSTGSGSSQRADHFWLPLVARDWQPGQPIRYLLKSDTQQLFETFAYVPPGQKPAAPPPVLARRAGPLPVPAQQAFAEMGITLTEPLYVLERIPSMQGKPIPLDRAMVDGAFWIGCGLLSFLFLVFWVAATIGLRRRAQAQGHTDPAASR